MSRSSTAVLVLWLVAHSFTVDAWAARRPRVPRGLHFEDRYAQALLEFGRQRDLEALSLAEELHQEVVAREVSEALPAMERETLALARKLGKSHHDALLAIARFHEQAYSRYLAGSQYPLASFSRQVAGRLLLEPPQGETAAFRAMRARLVASLAGRTHGARQWSGAADLYRVALDLDSSLGPAWLGLATIQEKRGSYLSAVASLRALSALPDAPPEASLRLGINLLRAEQPVEGRRRLAAILDSPSEPVWVRSLAAQELARDLLEGWEGERGLIVLEEAAATLPCDPALRVQLDYFRERIHRDHAAKSFDPGVLCEGSDLSTRARYSRFPDEPFAALDRDLDRDLAAARAHLVEALRRRGVTP